MSKWYYLSSVVMSMLYFIYAEDKTSILAFVAIMSYLYYIDDKIDKQ